MNRSHYKHLITAALGMVSGLLFYVYLSFGVADEDGTSAPTLYILASMLLGGCLAFIAQFISAKLDEVISWQKRPGLRLIVGIVLLFLVLISLSWAGILAYSAIFIVGEEIGKENLFLKMAILLLVGAVLYSVIYFAIYSWNLYTRDRVETIRQKRKQINLQLKALKSQLSPHFLFNSLNTVSSIMYKDQGAAEEFIRKLAFNYSYAIRNFENPFVPLAEELELVRSYSHQLNTRFGNAFDVQIVIDEPIQSSRIPPLTLQILVENAAKHNLSTSDNPVIVKITSNGKKIFIKNNVVQRTDDPLSYGIGLKNISSRYRLLAGKEIKVVSGKYFEVHIPVLL